jgi:hypothetical protein
MVLAGSTTITTVGSGDTFPVTGAGRLIAVGLMLAGIALLGVVTAALASWFVEKIGEVEAAEEQTQLDLARVLAELEALRSEVGGASRLREVGGLPVRRNARPPRKSPIHASPFGSPSRAGAFGRADTGLRGACLGEER